MGMTIDEIFSEVGELGRQQLKYIILLNLVHVYFPFYMLQYTFVARNVDFYCNINTSEHGLSPSSTTLSTTALAQLGRCIYYRLINSQTQLIYITCLNPDCIQF